MTLTDWISDNSKLLAYAIIGYVAAIQFGYVDAPEVPEWWPLVALLAASTAGVGFIVGGKIADLLPDQMDNILVSFDADDATGGEIWELNDEAFEQLDVRRGELFEWQCSGPDVYECRDFSPERLTAVANWKGTKTGSQLSQQVNRDDVMRQVETLREQHEEQARYGEAIRTSLPSLLRTLDKWRAKDLNAALEGHISPNLGDRSIDDMIREQLPERVLPDYLTADHSSDEPESVDADPGAVEFLDDTDDLLDPVDDPAGPLVNDGGTTDER